MCVVTMCQHSGKCRAVLMDRITIRKYRYGTSDFCFPWSAVIALANLKFLKFVELCFCPLKM